MADDIMDTAMSGTDDKAQLPPSANEPDPQLSSSNSIIVTPTVPYAFDLGNLLLIDTNPFLPFSSTSTTTSAKTTNPPTNPSNLNATLASTARSCAQSLLNQLLSTCPIHTTPTGATLTLPPPTTQLPREKRVPKPKAPTRWETFAAKKGIAGKQRGGKMVYDEERGEWVPKWGYKGANKDGEGDWLVEVDDDGDGDGDGVGLGKRKGGGNGEKDGARPSARKGSKEERRVRVKRNERRMRANEKRARRVEDR